MNIPIYEGLPYHDRFGTPIYPDFRNMLRVESILKDESIGNTEKTFACLSLLYGSIPKNLDVAFNELLWFLFCGEEPRKAGKGKSNTPIYDYFEDAPYIFAGFLSSYGIDLSNKDTHLHWWAFMALFIALPENTQMMRIMCDRNVDTSKMKGETKRYYEARKKAVALKPVKRKSYGTLEERKKARQDRLDELYAEAIKAESQKGR